MTFDKWDYIWAVHALIVSIAFVLFTKINPFVKTICILLWFSPLPIRYLSNYEDKVQLEAEKKNYDDHIANINEKYGTNFKPTNRTSPSILFDDSLLKILITGQDQFCENFDFITKWKTDNCSYVKIFTKDPKHICTVVKGNKNEIEYILSKLKEFESRWKATNLLTV